jgi:hypothetical protein
LGCWVEKECALLLLRAIVIWVLLAVVGVGNGVFRGAVLAKRLGDQPAHILATLILCALMFLVAVIFIRWVGPDTLLQASLVGLLWAVLTVSFEFLAGHYLFGNSWEKLLADYNIWRGRIWVLVPIVLYLAPRWAFKLRLS